ncbi:MAG: hypothetical protein VX733_08030 [Candidatus Latescibacterota bacterium]|nr:hypothetical protein [Candidatus Latescibacterota bacterium]
MLKKAPVCWALPWLLLYPNIYPSNDRHGPGSVRPCWVDPSAANREADGIASVLSAAGINLNLAPVVDLNVQGAGNPTIGGKNRSFVDPKALPPTPAPSCAPITPVACFVALITFPATA